MTSFQFSFENTVLQEAYFRIQFTEQIFCVIFRIYEDKQSSRRSFEPADRPNEGYFGANGKL